jgi:agmatine/peptidylarginine deiminase
MTQPNDTTVRDLIADLFRSDEQTGGQPVLSPDRVGPARAYLEQLLLDATDRLQQHIASLEQLYRVRFVAPLPRSWRQGGSPLAQAPTPGLRHSAVLEEPLALAVLEGGVERLPAGDLARLLLNPYALWDLADLLNTLLPDYWLDRMEERGIQWARESGIDLDADFEAVVGPAVHRDAESKSAPRPSLPKPGTSPTEKRSENPSPRPPGPSMIPDWQTDCVYFSGLLPAEHPALWESLNRLLDAAGVEHRLLARTRDIWVRDFMPVQVATGDFVLFRYQPHYLHGYDHLVTPDEVRGVVPPGGRVRPCNINLDGGNVVAARGRVILTNRIYNQNRERGRQELREELAAVLGAECIFIPEEPGDVIGHADGIVRFVEDGVVVINDYREIDPGYGERLEAALRRHGLAVERLPYFVTDEEHDGIPSAVGNYANFLRVGALVVVPAYGVPQDEEACQTLENLLPGAKVVPLRCEGLAQQGGVLNCVAWTVRTQP